MDPAAGAGGGNGGECMIEYTGGSWYYRIVWETAGTDNTGVVLGASAAAEHAVVVVTSDGVSPGGSNDTTLRLYVNGSFVGSVAANIVPQVGNYVPTKTVLGKHDNIIVGAYIYGYATYTRQLNDREVVGITLEKLIGLDSVQNSKVRTLDIAPKRTTAIYQSDSSMIIDDAKTNPTYFRKEWWNGKQRYVPGYPSATVPENKTIVATHRDSGDITTNNAVIVFNVSTIDTNSCYNSTTGVFTAKTANYYRVDVHGIASSGMGYIRVLKNGTGFVQWHSFSDDTWNKVGGSHIVELAVGDTVRMVTGFANGGTFYGQLNGDAAPYLVMNIEEIYLS